MSRGIFFCLMLASALAADACAQSRALVPTGGMWQSIPYGEERKESAEPLKPAASTKRAPTSVVRAAAPPKRARRPVAASTPAEPPRTSAAQTRELQRRIEALAPGTKLGRPIVDPQNPHWRRPRPGSTGPDGRDLAMPFDDSGRSGFVARGYHTDPNWENPRGTLGATFGLRAKF